jgi:chemotaxis protein methyltransferase CheR
MIPLSPDEFTQMAAHIESICGIYLDRSQAYLIEARLSKLVLELGFSSFRELQIRSVADLSRGIQKKIIDAITTRETLFFRDRTPYELLQQKILPEFIQARTHQKRTPATLRIWSAACSSGQEIYSIAMILKELLPTDGSFSTRLLATDISDAAIATASIGTYNSIEIERGLPKEKLQRYFSHEPGGWKIRDDIRDMVDYQKLNLREDFSRFGKFDIIFCRNVAIYFSGETKAQLFRRLEHSLEPDGYLIIGATETLTGINSRFVPKKYQQTYYYQLQG